MIPPFSKSEIKCSSSKERENIETYIEFSGNVANLHPDLSVKKKDVFVFASCARCTGYYIQGKLLLSQIARHRLASTTGGKKNT